MFFVKKRKNKQKSEKHDQKLCFLLKKLKNSVVSKTSILFITHNLGIVREIADRIIVMYAGTIVEEGSVEEVFNNPLHPYTKGLIQSLPEFNIDNQKKNSTYSWKYSKYE